MTQRRKKKQSLITLKPIQLIVLAAIAVGLLYVASRSAARSGAMAGVEVPADSLLLVREPEGLPSQPVAYSGFNLSFNPKMHIPNWVAWELTADETDGKEPRYNTFSDDPKVAGSAETYDYSRSGYDRGHMAPAADMKWSPRSMRESFFLTNICPQAKELNTGAWRTLEERSRIWARNDSAIIIIAGPILSPKPHEYIGDNRVAVPRSFFKVILSPYKSPVKAIAFVMPNGYVKGGYQQTVTTVDEVERLTGLDFFAALPDSIEDIIEASSDIHLWNNSPRKSTSK